MLSIVSEASEDQDYSILPDNGQNVNILKRKISTDDELSSKILRSSDVTSFKEEPDGNDQFSLIDIIPNRGGCLKFHTRDNVSNIIHELCHNYWRKGRIHLRCSLKYFSKCKFSGSIEPDVKLLENIFRKFGERERLVRSGFLLFQR